MPHLLLGVPVSGSHELQEVGREKQAERLEGWLEWPGRLVVQQMAERERRVWLVWPWHPGVEEWRSAAWREALDRLMARNTEAGMAWEALEQERQLLE